jgi:hypothetical protein
MCGVKSEMEKFAVKRVADGSVEYWTFDGWNQDGADCLPNLYDEDVANKLVQKAQAADTHFRYSAEPKSVGSVVSS